MTSAIYALRIYLTSRFASAEELALVELLFAVELAAASLDFAVEVSVDNLVVALAVVEVDLVAVAALALDAVMPGSRARMTCWAMIWWPGVRGWKPLTIPAG